MDEILRLTATDGDECGSVSISEMAEISDNTLLLLENKGLTSLQQGDFDGLTGLRLLSIEDNRSLTELPAGLFSDLSALVWLSLHNNALTALPSDLLSGLTNLQELALIGNQLDALPTGLFLGLTNLQAVYLRANPVRFRFTTRFEPETLDEDFSAESVRLVLREGAPRPITVSLLVTGGSLINGSPSSLTFAVGSTQTDSVTVIRGRGYFRLGQGDLELGGDHDFYDGFEIVRGPSITFGGVPVRVKVFLEGALE